MLGVAEIHLRGRGRDHGNGLPRRQIVEELLRVVRIVAGVMVAGAQTRAAMNAVSVVDAHFSGAVQVEKRFVGAVHGTSLDTFVATGTLVFVCKNSTHYKSPLQKPRRRSSSTIYIGRRQSFWVLLKKFCLKFEIPSMYVHKKRFWKEKHNDRVFHKFIHMLWTNMRFCLRSRSSMD